MKEHVCLFAMNGHVASSLWVRFGRRGDVLVMAVFLPGLSCLSLDGRLLANVGIGNVDLYEISNHPFYSK